MLKRPLALITPAGEAANNGNWQTASRWARLLASQYHVRLMDTWNDGDDELMIALHARRSAASVAAWARQRRGPLVLALTGTDLYRDIHSDAAAQHSLAVADRLLVLHERAVDDLPPAHRHKAVVCFQSCPARRTLPKTSQHLRALMVGHFRAEKDPQCYFDAARWLMRRPDIRLDHIGRSLEPELGQEAEMLTMQNLGYRWLGELDHDTVRRRIQRAHVLVHPSRMEGGAHVVMEAVRSGTPVLASRISGNVGMLGADYGGYFEPGDSRGLALALARCRDDADMLPALRVQCAARSALFEPAREQQTLLAVLQALGSSQDKP